MAEQQKNPRQNQDQKDQRDTEKQPNTKLGRDDAITHPDVPAQDLPDGGRGTVDTNVSKQSFTRDNPKRTGGQVGGEGGLRNEPGMDDLDRHGGRKKN